MNNDIFRLVILLSVLSLLIFPFAGLAPLSLLLFAAIVGWMFQMAGIVIGATAPEDVES